MKMKNTTTTARTPSSSSISYMELAAAEAAGVNLQNLLRNINSSNGDDDDGGGDDDGKNVKNGISNDRRRNVVNKKKKMFALLEQAESMYNITRFQICFQLFVEAETLVRQVYDPQLDSHMHYTLLAKAILGQAKAKFKMGDIKTAHSLVGQSMQFSPSTDAEQILREVEKMSYFENLLDFSLTNPLYAFSFDQQQYNIQQQQQQQQKQSYIGLDLPQSVGLYTRNSSLYASLMSGHGSTSPTLSASPPPPPPLPSSSSPSSQHHQLIPAGSGGKLALLDQQRNLTTLDYFSLSSVVVSTVPKAITQQAHKPDGLLETSSGGTGRGGYWQQTFLEHIKKMKSETEAN